MSKSLIQETEDLRSILETCDSIAEEGKEIPAALEEKLTNALTGHASKVDRCCSYVEKAKSDIEWLKNEKKKIDTAAKGIQRSIDRMLEVAGMVMTTSKERKLSGLKGHYFSKKSSSASYVSDIDSLPEEYKTTEVVTKVDKNKLLEDLRSGKKIPGAELAVKDTIVSK